MRLFNLAFIASVLLFSVLSNALYSQNQDLRTSVADLTQDFSALDRQVRSIQFELELLKENQNSEPTDKAIRLLNAKILKVENELKNLRIEMAQRDRALGEQLLSKVTARLDEYFKSLNQSMGASQMAESVSQPLEFSDDYPKTGLSYEVQPGDTLSQIALKFGSTVRFIQDANQIKDPARDLRVGDTIFIPLKEN
jgi:LysM repeat protein